MNEEDCGSLKSKLMMGLYKDKHLVFIDAAGKQVRWLQFALKQIVGGICSCQYQQRADELVLHQYAHLWRSFHNCASFIAFGGAV